MRLKKNESHVYIGLVIARCPILRLMLYVCFKGNPTVEIYKIIQVKKHVLFNVTFIKLALHTHTACKLERFFKRIAFCGVNSPGYDPAFVDNIISLVLA
jgi:hypothetical protein